MSCKPKVVRLKCRRCRLWVCACCQTCECAQGPDIPAITNHIKIGPPAPSPLKSDIIMGQLDMLFEAIADVGRCETIAQAIGVMAAQWRTLKAAWQQEVLTEREDREAEDAS